MSRRTTTYATRPASRSRILAALIAGVLVAVLAAQASALLVFPTRTQSAFNNILATIDGVESPTAKQRLIKKSVGKFTKKVFKSNRSAAKCIGDMKKIVRKAGATFDAETEFGPMAELRANLIDRLRNDVLAGAAVLEGQVNAADLSPKAVSKFNKTKDTVNRLADEIATLRGNDPELDAGSTGKALSRLKRVVQELETAARRLRKAGLSDARLRLDAGF